MQESNAFEEMCHASLALVKEHATLFSLESTLAKQSFIPFLGSLICAVILCITLWLTVLVSCFFAFLALSHNMAISLGGTLLIQIALLCLSMLLIKQYKERLAFKQTRASFHELLGNKNEH